MPVEGLTQGEGPLPAGAAHHVARVLRLGRGDLLTLFDPATGRVAEAAVLSVDGGDVRVAVGPVSEGRRAGRAITLLQAIGKGDKMDAVIRDATELDVARVIPVLTARTVVQPGARAAERLARWRRVAAEAARQCGRAQAPEIDEIQPLARAAASVEAPLRLALAPEAGRAAGPLLLAEEGAVAFVVGPEGGLDAAEIEALEAAGWVAASLGPTVLRTETVATAVLGALLLASGR